MNITDVKRIMKLLGGNGTAAGLKASDIDLRSIRSLVVKICGRENASDDRENMIDALVSKLSETTLKPTDELMGMTFEELESYFNRVSPSNDDLMKIMKELNYKVSAEDKKHLRRFVARQISETALFSKVANRQDR
jgi:hypothetical protein